VSTGRETGAKAITATPPHRPNPKELVPRTGMGSVCPQQGTRRPLPAHLPNCTGLPLPRGSSLLLGVETRQVHALWGADFGRKETPYARALLGGRRDFLHAEAEWSHEAVWEDIHRSMLPDARRSKTFSMNFFMSKWLLWGEVFLGAWRKLQRKPFARVRLGNERCLAQNFGRHLILAKLQCPSVLEQGFAYSRETAFNQRREFCCYWNNLPEFCQDIEASGEISVCTSSGKSSWDLPQGQFALSMFSTRTPERSLLKTNAEHLSDLHTRPETSGANTSGEPWVLLLGPGSMEKADAYLNADERGSKSRQRNWWNR